MSKANLKSILSSIGSKDSESFGKTLENIASSLKSMPSILARDVKIEGTLKSSGVIEIEGKVQGTIHSNSVVIREDGIVDGEVYVDSVNIRGTFNGMMKARNVSIFSKANVTGTIEYQTLSVEDGASIEGQFKQSSEKRS